MLINLILIEYDLKTKANHQKSRRSSECQEEDKKRCYISYNIYKENIYKSFHN